VRILLLQHQEQFQSSHNLCCCQSWHPPSCVTCVLYISRAARLALHIWHQGWDSIYTYLYDKKVAHLTEFCTVQVAMPSKLVSSLDTAASTARHCAVRVLHEVAKHIHAVHCQEVRTCGFCAAASSSSYVVVLRPSMSSRLL
jgi:hypothetical protein